MKRVKLLDHVVSNHKLILPHGTKDMRHKQKCQIQCMSKKKGRKVVRSWYYLRQVRDCPSPTGRMHARVAREWYVWVVICTAVSFGWQEPRYSKQDVSWKWGGGMNRFIDSDVKCS